MGLDFGETDVGLEIPEKGFVDTGEGLVGVEMDELVCVAGAGQRC